MDTGHKHKGHAITLASGLRFTAEGFGFFDTAEGLMKAIDENERKQYRKVPALIVDRWKPAIVEAVATRPHRDGQFWVMVDGKRSTSGSAFADTPENRAIVEAIIKAKRDEVEASGRGRELYASLTGIVMEEVAK